MREVGAQHSSFRLLMEQGRQANLCFHVCRLHCLGRLTSYRSLVLILAILKLNVPILRGVALGLAVRS